MNTAGFLYTLFSATERYYLNELRLVGIDPENPSDVSEIPTLGRMREPLDSPDHRAAPISRATKTIEKRRAKYGTTTMDSSTVDAMEHRGDKVRKTQVEKGG